MDSDYDYLHQQSTAHTTQLSPCAFVYEGGKQARQAKEQARCTELQCMQWLMALCIKSTVTPLLSVALSSTLPLFACE